MDCSSLYEVKEDGKVFKPMQYYETEDEIVETEETGDKTEQKTEAMRLGLLTFISLMVTFHTILILLVRLHLAAERENAFLVSHILELCPSPAQGGPNGRTDLHAAVLYNNEGMTQKIHDKKVALIIKEADNQGWTAWNYAAYFDCSKLLTTEAGLFSIFQLTIVTELEVVKQLEKFRARCFRSIIYMEDCEARQNEHKSVISEIENSQESHLIVAALIVTVTFVAGFTMPGGYNGNAILARKTAFQAFMIINPVAMVLSISAVFIHLSLVLVDGKTMFVVNFGSAQLVILFAMGSMVIAFITGTYAVLQHSP
ncbi:uncharacterized protein LOC125423262 [Ziziphus jujuba]|uniref:Uncharacterized protein LOC125423262 n=1 Tax=Ziziphus jujuba TaxID=326968 RepID=A0ABM4A3U7_ZIZJJ|nr:uncharacterized protein LOC125423262 [Ziziphus jujuba]